MIILGKKILVNIDQKYFITTSLIILSLVWFLFHRWWLNKYGFSWLGRDDDFVFYFSGRSWVSYGMRLFKDGYAEYPLLGLAYINWPKIFTNNFEVYSILLGLSNLGLYVVCGYLICILVKKFNNNYNGWWLWCLPSVLYYSFNRFDIFPVFLVLVSIWLIVSNKIKFGWAVYSLAVMTKIYPILLFPLYISLTPLWRKKLGWLLGFLLPIVIVFLIGALAVGWVTVIYPLIIQTTRGFEPGSLIYMLFEFGGSILFVNEIKLFFLTLSFILPLFWLINIYKNKIIRWCCYDNFIVAALVLLFFINFYPFYSPQWWLWVLPFLIFTMSSKGRWVIVLYDIFNYLHILIFSLYGRYSIGFQTVVWLRSLILCYLIWFMVYRVWHLRRNNFDFINGLLID